MDDRVLPGGARRRPSRPIVGLGSSNFTGLVITSLAAAVVARLRSVPLAFGVAIAMGVLQSVLIDVAPTGSLLATAVQPAIPLIVLIIFLLVGPTIEQTSTTQVIVAGDRPVADVEHDAHGSRHPCSRQFWRSPSLCRS